MKCLVYIYIKEFHKLLSFPLHFHGLKNMIIGILLNFITRKFKQYKLYIIFTKGLMMAASNGCLKLQAIQ